MATDPKLEAYLTVLDKALGPISVSDRADILTEIKSHILEAQARDPGQSMHAILSSLGEPETVANRYLMERGLKTARPPRAPIVKWLTIGFLGTFGMICLTTLALIWKFSPLISVDDANERVILLGGLIDIDGKAGVIKGPMNIGESEWQANTFEGSEAIDQKSIQQIEIPFSNGKFEITASADDRIHWDCKVFGSNKPADFQREGGKFMLNLEKAAGSKCEIGLPSHVKTVIRGGNGKFEVLEPNGPLEITMSNGKVEIDQDETKNYKFDLNVTNGNVDKFESSSAPDAIAIKVAIANGKISRN